MREQSFGVIPLWRDGENYEVLLIQSRKYGHWGWPKGRGEAGENNIAAARREFEEETGITDYFLITDRIFQEAWQYRQDKKLYEKTASYFLGFVRAKAVKPQAAEIAAYKWADVAQAGDLLSFPEKQAVLKEVQEYLRGIKINNPS